MRRWVGYSDCDDVQVSSAYLLARAEARDLQVPELSEFNMKVPAGFGIVTSRSDMRTSPAGVWSPKILIATGIVHRVTSSSGCRKILVNLTSHFAALLNVLLGHRCSGTCSVAA